MRKEEKLKLAIDFIADYLSEEVTTEVVNEDEDVVVEDEDNSIKRAYSIMMKLDDRDKTKANIKQAVNKAVDPIKQELLKVKSEYQDKLQEEKVNERSGVTLDDGGNMVKVVVESLPSSNARPAFVNANDVEKAVKTMLTDDKNSELDMEDGPLTHNED